MTSYSCVMTRYSYCSPDAGTNGEIPTESFTRLMQVRPQCYNLYFESVAGIEERIIRYKSS